MFELYENAVKLWRWPGGLEEDSYGISRLYTLCLI